MSLRRADVRFMLPRPVRRAVVLGGLTAWEDGLRQAGVETARSADGPHELVVAPGRLRAAALALQPAMLVLEGARSVRGLQTRLVQPLPNADAPELLLPLGERAAIRYAMHHRRRGGTAATRLRNVLATEALAHGLRVPGRAPTAVAARAGGPPFVAAPALDALELSRSEGFAAFSRWADPFSRGAYLLFAPGEPEPGWVVKFARLPGTRSLFDADERGLRLAEQAGGTVAAHAPRLVERYEVAGLQASVETAAVGELLSDVLDSPAPREQRLGAVDRIARWIVAVARESAAPPQSLAAERARLAAEVVPRWVADGLPPALVDALPPLQAVFQHGDLSSENVFVREDGFTVVDWESARADGLPLWDVFYFLTHALAAVDGVRSEDEREQHFVRLWRGELPSSSVLFRWIRAAAEATGVPAEAVGPLASLLWLSYAVLDAGHVERVSGLEARERAADPATLRIARRWLADPALGPSWNRWSG